MDKELLQKIYLSTKNLIIEGDIASGKTSNIGIPIIKNIIKHNESVLMIDSKEEYLNKYYNSFKDRGYNVIIVNLRDLTNSDGYNFLSYPYKLYKEKREHESVEFIERVYKQLFDTPEAGTDSFWNNSAINFLEGLTITLFEDGTPNQVNINSIVNMIDQISKDNSKHSAIIKYFQNKNSQDLSYILTTPTIMAPPETKGGIVSTANQAVVKLISSTNLKRFFNKTTFNYKDILSKPTAIFIVTKDEYPTLNFIANIFINQLYYMLILNNNARKFNLVLDNFDTIKEIDNLKEILSSGLSRKIKTTIITRSIKDLEKKYGRYIYTLSDVINIKKHEILANIEGEKLETNNTKHKLKTPKTTYKVNKIKRKDIKVFNIESKPDGKEIESFYKRNEKIEELIRRIDEKIKKLELEEKEEEQKKATHLEKINQKIKALINESENDNFKQEEDLNISKKKYNPFSDEEMKKLEEKIQEKIKESQEKSKNNDQIEKKEEVYIKFNPFSDEEMQRVIEKRTSKLKKQERPYEEESKQDSPNLTSYKKYRQRKVNKKKIIDQKIIPDNNKAEPIKKSPAKRGFLSKLFG